MGVADKSEKEGSAGEGGGGLSMRDNTNFGSAFERVATYMAQILLSSVLGYTYGVISGAVVAGPQGSLKAESSVRSLLRGLQVGL